jgi:hypothetical protein
MTSEYRVQTAFGFKGEPLRWVTERRSAYEDRARGHFRFLAQTYGTARVRLVQRDATGETVLEGGA